MKSQRIIATFFFAILALLGTAAMAQQDAPAATSTRGDIQSFTAGKFVANNYVYTGPYSAAVYTGNAATGSSTMTIRGGYIVLRDGRSIVPYAVGVPLVVSDASAELVTPTAVSGCYKSQGANQDGVLVTCTITASFAALHGQGASILSATGGVAEAANDAFNWGGGVVAITPGFALNTSCTGCYASKNAMLAALLPYHSVSIEDDTVGPIQYWNASPTATTALATPTTLTAVTALPSATPVGAYGTGTYYFCISYVDIMGNEGTCSATFNQAGLATGSFIFSSPAASTGAVGYTIYISLTSGSYAFAYKVPLTSSICTLTKIETVTAACAVANATYGQSGATATVTAITVNTAMLAPNATTTSSTTDYVPNPNARTTYAYIPSNHIALPGVVAASLPFPIGAAAATTVPNVIGTLTLPAGFMNYVGRTIEVCGFATEATNGSTSTITTFQLWWDAAGSNAAGVPVLVGTIAMTNTLVTAKSDQFQFCMDLKTTVAGAGVTAGTIFQTYGYFQEQYTSSSVATVPVSVLSQAPAAVGSLNLAGEARIDVVYLHTTGTDANGVTLQDLTVKVLN